MAAGFDYIMTSIKAGGSVWTVAAHSAGGDVQVSLVEGDNGQPVRIDMPRDVALALADDIRRAALNIKSENG